MTLDVFLLKAHVAAGCGVLALGLIPIVARKGGRWHNAAGRLYVWGMALVCATALGLMPYRFNLFLTMIAVFSFHMTFTGYRVLRRRAPGSQRWYDWLAAGLATATGLGMIGYGVYALAKVGLVPLVALCAVFGSIMLANGWADIRQFRRPPTARLWWMRHHIAAMLGAYIAAITAFAVQGVPRLIGDWAYTWLLWLLPTLLVTPLIMYWQRRYPAKRPAAAGQAGN